MAEEPQQQLLTSETHLLAMLGQGAPMLEILNELCNFIDTQSPGAISTFFLLDSDGRRFGSVAGGKAAKRWNERYRPPKGRTMCTFLRSGRRH